MTVDQFIAANRAAREAAEAPRTHRHLSEFDQAVCEATAPKPAPTCRGRLSHQNRPAYARVWFNELPGQTPIDRSGMPVCRACSKEMLAWMMAGTVNAVGQYPTAHYPIEKGR